MQKKILRVVFVVVLVKLVIKDMSHYTGMTYNGTQVNANWRWIPKMEITVQRQRSKGITH